MAAFGRLDGLAAVCFALCLALCAGLGAEPRTKIEQCMDRAARSGGISTARLPDGLTVFAEQRAGALSVHVGIWVRAGSRRDPVGKEGLAHLVEHMVFRAASESGLQAIFEGHTNAVTTPDYTYYCVTTLPEHAAAVVRGLRRDVLGTQFDRSSVRAEIRVLLRESAHWQADPVIRVARSVIGRLDLADDVRQLLRGGPRSPEALTAEDARRFHDAFYRPESVILFLSGDFRAWPSGIGPLPELRPGPVPERVPRERGTPVTRLPAEMRFHTLVDRVYAAAVCLHGGWHLVPPEDMALFEQALGEWRNGLLSVTLREQMGITDNILLPAVAGLATPVYCSDFGLAGVGVIAPGGSGKQVREVLHGALRTLRRRALTDEQCRIIASAAATAEQSRLQAPHARAVFLLSEYSAGRSRTVEAYVDAIEGMSPEQVRDVLAVHSAKGRTGILLVEPARGPGRLWALLRYVLLGRI
jgi:predicted Zn-dependent peptidase